MAFKPNYQQQRGDRVRAKDKKKQDRLQRREAKRADADQSESAGDDTGVGDNARPAEPPAEGSSG